MLINKVILTQSILHMNSNNFWNRYLIAPKLPYDCLTTAWWLPWLSDWLKKRVKRTITFFYKQWKWINFRVMRLPAAMCRLIILCNWFFFSVNYDLRYKRNPRALLEFLRENPTVCWFYATVQVWVTYLTRNK